MIQPEVVTWRPVRRVVTASQQDQVTALSKGLLLLSEYTRYAPDLKAKAPDELLKYVRVYLETIGRYEVSDIQNGCLKYLKREKDYPKSPLELKPYIKGEREMRLLQENENAKAIEQVASMTDEDWAKVQEIRKERNAQWDAMKEQAK